MPLSLKLPVIDNNPILLAETRPNKISEFIQNLPFGDPIRAADDLAEELRIINTQRVAYSNRLNALELYRPAVIQIYQDLLPHFNRAALPISNNEQTFATAAERLWQELAYGYKFALVDLQNKILNINSTRSTAMVVQRAIHALKEIALIHYMTYRSPAGSLWSELHQLYFCALQQNANLPIVPSELADSNESSVNLVYMQAMLMALANPHRLASQDIIKAETYLTKIAAEAELRPLGLIDNPTGIFLISLNSDKPPIPYSKNRNIPNPETDIILVTIAMARRIHSHLKTMQTGILPSDSGLPSDASQQHYEDLLTHLIKHFGKTPLRVFSRNKKSDGLELGIGMQDAHYLVQKVGSEYQNLMTTGGSIKPSRWQILNTSAGGYAMRKFNSSPAKLFVGDIAAIRHNQSTQWELGIIRWANMNEMSQLEAGIELIAPSCTAAMIGTSGQSNENMALVLPAVAALKQPASIIAPRACYAVNQTVVISQKEGQIRAKLTRVLLRTNTFERFEFDLI